MEKFTKFQSIYKEITGESIDWEDIPGNLREVLLNSSGLNAREIAKLPFNVRVAYLVANKPPDSVILEKVKKQLTFYESKYGISSEEFYRKYHNSESMYEGSNERALDFLSWHGEYTRYLELKNGNRR